MKKEIYLLNIENDENVDQNTNDKFFLLLQSSLLLALKERKLLNDSQCRNALKQLGKTDSR